MKKSVSQIIVTVYSSQTPVTTREAPSDRDRGDIATVTAAVEISIKTINIPTPTPPPLTRSTGGRIRRVSGSVRFGCTRRRTLPSVSYFTRRMTFEMQGWGKLWLPGVQRQTERRGESLTLGLDVEFLQPLTDMKVPRLKRENK